MSKRPKGDSTQGFIRPSPPIETSIDTAVMSITTDIGPEHSDIQATGTASIVSSRRSASPATLNREMDVISHSIPLPQGVQSQDDIRVCISATSGIHGTDDAITHPASNSCDRDTDIMDGGGSDGLGQSGIPGGLQSKDDEAVTILVPSTP